MPPPPSFPTPAVLLAFVFFFLRTYIGSTCRCARQSVSRAYAPNAHPVLFPIYYNYYYFSIILLYFQIPTSMLTSPTPTVKHVVLASLEFRYIFLTFMEPISVCYGWKSHQHHKNQNLMVATS